MMEVLVFGLVGLIAILLVGALASVFGADSRESIGDDRADTRTLAAGGGH